MQTIDQALEYDVVIMGAGYAGVCQARHLLLKIPNIRIAIVDPRSENPSKLDHRPGESTLEAASMFLFSELGLHDYLLEQHTHKAGLNWHWPKDVEKTESLDDYYNIWVNRQLTIPSFHLNRLKFDLDVLEMNKQMGAHFYNGRVVDLDLTPGDELNTVKVKLHDDYIQLKSKHLIDAAGRKFIIGRKTDNLLLNPKELPVNIKPSSGWVLVKNVDRTIFDNSVYSTESLESRYYATNHWMGKGHWLWMIPVDTQTKELSVGLIHHPDVIPSELVNTKEKFYAFLKANHNILYQLLKSGEHVEFNYWPKIAHASIMSWRLYGNYMVWFNTLLPIYVGKWHLDLLFSRLALIFFKINSSFWVDTFKQLSYLAERKTNIGFMDQLRADQLIRGYHPDKFFDNFLENAKLEPGKLNVFAGLRAYCFYIVIWFIMLQWKGFGLIGLLRPRNIFQIVRLLLTGVVMLIAELMHKLQLLGQPTNSTVADTRQEFKSYRYQSRLQNWVDTSEITVARNNYSASRYYEIQFFSLPLS
jgi:flavin-dependent dehydrogenase